MINYKVLNLHVSQKNMHLISSLNKLQLIHKKSRAEVVLMLLTYYEYGVLDKNELEST
jgi:hypothetical protein